jgi:polyphosphate kinase 2
MDQVPAGDIPQLHQLEAPDIVAARPEPREVVVAAGGVQRCHFVPVGHVGGPVRVPRIVHGGHASRDPAFRPGEEAASCIDIALTWGKDGPMAESGKVVPPAKAQKGSAKASSRKKGAPVALATAPPGGAEAKLVTGKQYDAELKRLQTELVRMQEWIVHEGLRVCVLFEGRDTAGKGGTIKRIMERLNARYARVVALGTPTERERTQWYFQRYIPHLPAAGEIVLFDRSWYNRAGVEHVMGFCTPEEYDEFLRTCPQIERALVRSGIVLVKYWLSISDEEQERRFRERIDNPGKRWKLSPMDLQARARWVDYAEAKDEMFGFTDIKEAPWHVVDANDKKAARLNLISHLLTMVPYKEVPFQAVELPPRQERAYKRPPIDSQTWIPERYRVT